MSHDPLFMAMLKDLDLQFAALESPAPAALRVSSQAPAIEGETHSAPGLQARPNCEDCGDTGRREHALDGADVYVRCWCEAGDL